MSKDAFAQEIAGNTVAGLPKIILVDADGKVIISLASDAVAAAIKTQTDKLGDATIGLANIKALIDAIDDYVDTEVAAIKAKTDLIAIAGTDAATNTDPFLVIGSKADTAVTVISSIASIVAYVKGILNQVTTVITQVATTVAGRMQEATTTEDLNQTAGTYDLLTGATQVVILESLVIQMPVGAAGGALTSISIQTDDAIPAVIISAAAGVVTNLTSETQLSWTGSIRIGVGKKIRLTIAGGAHGVAYVCNVNAQYRSVVSGGTLV